MTIESLTRTVDQAIVEKDLQALEGVFSATGSWQSIGQGEQRSLAAHFIYAAMKNSDFLDVALPKLEQTFVIVLGHLPATVPEAADNKLRQSLFDYKVNTEADYAGAARILASMRIEDDTESPYYVDPVIRTDIYVKIAECFLAEDEIAEADAAVNKAGGVIMSIPNKEKHTALMLRYKSTNARVLDANRKFLQAASRYHELSESAADLIDDDELLQMLGRAVTCAILAPSGPQRARVLGKIFKDERLSQLNALEGFTTHSTILKKMFLNQILQPEELTKFEASLVAHQKAIMGDGLTIMERGVVEHNMVAVANVYSSIRLEQLAQILGVDERKAEQIAANMLIEGSIHGSINQVHGLLEFEDDETKEQAWDRSITSFCSELAQVADIVKARM